MMKRLSLLALLLGLLSAAGCQAFPQWLNVSQWLKKDKSKAPPTLFEESTNAWDGTWAEQP